MGKSPAEAKKAEKKTDEKIKNVLFYTCYVKENGAFGIKRQFKKVDVNTLK